MAWLSLTLLALTTLTTVTTVTSRVTPAVSPGAPTAPAVSRVTLAVSPGATTAPAVSRVTSAVSPGAPTAPAMSEVTLAVSPGAPTAPAMSEVTLAVSPGATTAPAMSEVTPAVSPGATTAPAMSEVTLAVSPGATTSPPVSEVTPAVSPGATKAPAVSRVTLAVSPGAPTSPPVSEVTLDMALGSFDDRYRGCSRAMAAALPALNRSELRGDFGRAWTLATAEWGVRRGPVSPLSPAQAIALLSYTSPLSLHRSFSAAVRVAGRSPREYRDAFPFKALHFLLTAALGALRAAEARRGQRCHRAFRGLRGLRARARPGDIVRFGHFASATRSEGTARGFGCDTLIEIFTCHGALIRDFSFFPLEDEVLVPPFETFLVTNVTRDGDTARLALSSTGTYSTWNCLWVKGQRCGDGPCQLDTGWSVPRSPPHLGGLLVATTALAVATGTL